MPNRLTSMLGAVFAGSVGVYVSLVIVTVFFASVQTDLGGSVTNTEAAIGVLEQKYYDAVASVTASDPTQYGFVKPSQKIYAMGTTLPALSRAQ